ncbi:MAG: hypothetical protein LBI84_06315 [Propionibacteriaceae bacterium]|jgi:hypothetical protein|nr:hypothetical protein [Propionibacteriaceae bacterium]
MLKRWLGGALTVFLTAAATVVGTAPAASASTCVPSAATWGGGWSVTVTCSEDTAYDGAGGAGGSAAGSYGPAYCTNALGVTLLCAGPWGSWFDSARRCHVNVASSHPDDPAWAGRWHGRTTGYLLNCYLFDAYSNVVSNNVYWSATTSPEPGSNAIEAALGGLFETGALHGSVVSPDLGVFPGGLVNPDRPEVMGVVGVPVWFWAKNPTGVIATPASETTQVDGWLLWADVSLAFIDYDTGDNETMRCDGLGSDPTGRIHEPTVPPDGCTHTYLKKGDYEVTAATYARLRWRLGSQSGDEVFLVEPRQSGVYHVGEIQVLNVNR